MAIQFAAVPSSVLALPFLLARSRSEDFEWTVRAALSAAIAAEHAVDTGRRNTRARLAYLLCELGFQLDRRGVDRSQSLPILRAELASALGTSLCRVKRTLALLSLSGVVQTDGKTVRVTDWHRLTSLAGYDPARLELEPREDADAESFLIVGPDGELQANGVTASGDQACFV